MQIDWMLLTFLFVGFFAIVGFFRGWWKEAITTFFLAVLVLLLQRQDWALAVINFLNWVIATVWGFVVRLLGLSPTDGPPQFDASSAGTWIIILILTLGLAALISRLTLPGFSTREKVTFYAVGLLGRLLGGLLGALNGFLVISLLREYLDGRALPGNIPPETEITVAGSSIYGPASTSVSIQAVNLPSFTILDSYLPWFIIGLGLLILFAALRNRVRVISSADGRKIEGTAPFGYSRIEKKPSPPERPLKVEVANQ
jgi:hypothetical protein